MANRHTTDWVDGKEQQLRALWADESLSAAEIGRRLGISKNAVLGKVHRLDLPARQSPIGRGNPRPCASPEQAAQRSRWNAAAARVRARKAAAASAPTISRPPPSPVMNGEKSAQAAREAERRAFRPPVHHNSTPMHYGGDSPCRWPTGDKGVSGIRFECAAPREPSRPYCSEHCARAYTGWRREIAA